MLFPENLLWSLFLTSTALHALILIASPVQAAAGCLVCRLNFCLCRFQASSSKVDQTKVERHRGALRLRCYWVSSTRGVDGVGERAGGTLADCRSYLNIVAMADEARFSPNLRENFCAENTTPIVAHL